MDHGRRLTLHWLRNAVTKQAVAIVGRVRISRDRIVTKTRDAFARPTGGPGWGQAARAVAVTWSSTATSSSAPAEPNRPSGPCGATSVNGDSYSAAAGIAP